MTHEEMESRLSTLEAGIRELSAQIGQATVSIAALMFHESFITKEQLADVVGQNETLQKNLKG